MSFAERSYGSVAFGDGTGAGLTSDKSAYFQSDVNVGLIVSASKEAFFQTDQNVLTARKLAWGLISSN